MAGHRVTPVVRMLVTWAIACALLSAPAAADDALRRWAIVAADEVRQSGLADLLIAEATKLPAIELVERDELDRVANELAIGSLVAPDGVAGRAKAGRLLRADALLLLSPAAGDPAGTLRLVICECRQGARLTAVDIARQSVSLEDSARLAAAEIARVRQHYGGGIRLVVGVPPLVSRNLEHRFDHLQSRYAELIAGSLSLQPGVAVVEVDEARAIVKERSLAAGGEIERITPFILSGSFRMFQPAAGGESLVETSIELTAGDKSRTMPVKSLPLSEVPAWLMNELAGELLAATGEKFMPLDSRQQREALLRQADAFSQLGDWPRSAGLREAGLALDTSDATQHARLVDNYQQRFVRDFQQLWSWKKVPEAARLPMLEQAADRFISAMEHLEYLVRNRRIGRDEATALLQRQKWEGPGAFFHQISQRPADEKAALERLLDAERRFVVDSGAIVPELPDTPALPAAIVPPRNPEPWHDVLLRRVMNQVEYRQHDRTSLEYLAKVLTRVLPPQAPTSYSTSLFLQQYSRELCEERYRNDPERGQTWAAFLQTLLESDRDTARLYGRMGTLEYSRARLGDPKSAAREDIVRLLREVDEVLYEIVGRRSQSDDVFHTLFTTRRSLLGQLDPALSPDSPKELPAATSLGRLRFQPIDLRLSSSDKPLAGYAAAPSLPTPQPPFVFEGQLNCGKFDAWWGETTFFLMHRPGELRPLPLTGHPQWSRFGAFSNVTWDGECLWLLVAGWGVYVLDAEGNLLTMYNSSTPLPGIDHGLQLLGVSPRRALAVGSFGEHHRAWCGMLEVSADNKPGIRLFHEATRVPEGRPPQEANADPATAFQPSWIHRFHGQEDDQTVLVGRNVPIGGGVRLSNRPLSIDLKTLAVGVVECETRGFAGNGAMFSRDGHVLHASSSVYHFAPSEQRGQLGAPARLFDHPFPYFHQLVPHDGWLYVPGNVWRRIRQDNFEVEYLLRPATVLPGPYNNLRIGVSAQYGLIGFRSHLYPNETGNPVLYQVSIAGEDP